MPLTASKTHSPKKSNDIDVDVDIDIDIDIEIGDCKCRGRSLRFVREIEREVNAGAGAWRRYAGQDTDRRG